MSAQDTERAAPAGTLRDPQVTDRLVGATSTPPSIPGKTLATVAAHHDRAQPCSSSRTAGRRRPCAALTRNADGSASGALGKLLDLLTSYKGGAS
jgi:hypothetical protein